MFKAYDSPEIFEKDFYEKVPEMRASSSPENKNKRFKVVYPKAKRKPTITYHITYKRPLKSIKYLPMVYNLRYGSSILHK